MSEESLIEMIALLHAELRIAIYAIKVINKPDVALELLDGCVRQAERIGWCQFKRDISDKVNDE
jgi:hypothetical protein